MLSRTAASLSAGFIGTTSFAVEIVVGLNFCLDVRHCLHLVGQLRGIHEVRIDVREIHHRQIEPGEFVDRESLALFLFRATPRLAELGAALLLQDARELAFETAIGSALGRADAEKTR